MSHPTLATLLGAASSRDEAVEAHLRGCADCRRLASLADLSEDATRDLGELPAVARDLYPSHGNDRLGAGGMGRAYRARDRALGRDVALKLPLARADVTDPLVYDTLLRRFEREARLTARLQHPGIVSVYHAGRFPDGEPFYTMRLVAGTPLSEEIARRGTLAERLALLPSLIVAAEAVAYAHSLSVVHRDVKPDNVLCGPFGETVVIDWGLATELDATDGDAGGRAAVAPFRAAEISLTAYGVGTPPYLPPEQATGSAADPRADVYSLGATLYELLAGAPPYRGGDAAALRAAIIAGPPPPLLDVCAQVPPPLAAVVARAMARDPAARYPTALELAAELRRFQTGQLVSAHRYSPAELARLFVRRHRAALGVAAAALIVLAALGAAAVNRVVFERDRAERERRAAEAASHDAARQLRVAQGITASQLAATADRRLDALALAVQAVGNALAAGEQPAQEALQGLVDVLAAGPATLPLAGHHTAVAAATQSADGTRLLTADDAGHLFIWSLPEGRREATHRISLTRPATIVSSPDGRWVLLCGWDDHAQAVEVETGAARDLERAAQVRRCAFLPDGTALTAGRDLARWDAATGRELGRLPLGAQGVALAVRGDGLVAAGGDDGSISLWEPARGDGRAAARIPAHAGPVMSLAFDGEGALYSGGEDGRVLAWTPSLPPGTSPPSTLLAGAGRVYLLAPLAGGRLAIGATGANTGELKAPGSRSVVISPAAPATRVEAVGRLGEPFPGGHELLASEIPRVEILDPATGASMLSLDGLEARLIAPAPGRSVVAAGDVVGHYLLWDVRRGRSTGLLVGHSGAITALAPSPAGDRVLTTALDGTARVWRLADGAELARIQAPPGVALLGGGWSTDGSRVLLAGDDGAVLLCAATGGVPLARLAGAAPLTAWAFAEGDLVATGDTGGQVTLWRADGVVERRFAAGGRVGAIAFLPGGRVATAHLGGGVRLWDPAGGALAERVAEPDALEGPVSITLLPGGDTIVVGQSGGAALLLDARDLSERGRLEGVLVSPGSMPGGLLATATADGRVHFAGPDGRQLSMLPAGAPVSAVVTSRDGARVIVARRSGDVEVWNLAQRERELVIRAAAGLGEPIGVAHTSDGTSAVIAYASGALRLYPLTAQDAMQRACAQLAWFGRDEPAVTSVCRAYAR